MTTITSNKSVIVATSDVMSTLSSKGMTTIVIESTSTSESMSTNIPSGMYARLPGSVHLLQGY